MPKFCGVCGHNNDDECLCRTIGYKIFLGKPDPSGSARPAAAPVSRESPVQHDSAGKAQWHCYSCQKTNSCSIECDTCGSKFWDTSNNKLHARFSFKCESGSPIYYSDEHRRCLALACRSMLVHIPDTERPSRPVQIPVAAAAAIAPSPVQPVSQPMSDAWLCSRSAFYNRIHAGASLWNVWI